MLQEIIVNLQNENQITICICDHQAREPQLKQLKNLVKVVKKFM